MSLKRDTKFGGESTCHFKTDMRNLTNLTWALENLKNFQVNGLLLSKVYIVWAKKVQRNYFSWHWKVTHNLKKNWLVVSKMTCGVWYIFSRELKSVKISIWLDLFVQSRKYMSLKFRDMLCAMKMKKNAKIEEELTCRFKIDMWNFPNLTSKV